VGNGFLLPAPFKSMYFTRFVSLRFTARVKWWVTGSCCPPDKIIYWAQPISVENAIKICTKFRVDIGWLLMDNENMNRGTTEQEPKMIILSIAINCAFKIFVQNLFCVILECKIYFALSWSAKFILRYLGVQNLFCVIYGMQNLFCEGLIIATL